MDIHDNPPDEDELDSEFLIDTPDKAAWAVKIITNEQRMAEDYAKACDAEITRLRNAKAEYALHTGERTANLRDLLQKYAATAPRHETKTGATIPTPHGTIRIKFATQKMVPDDEKLLEKLAGTDYIKLDPTVKWGEYKKRLAVSGDSVIDKVTGEVVDGVGIENVPERIEVEANG